jgi:hypothetical protein
MEVEENKQTSKTRVIRLEGVRSDYLRRSPEEIALAEAALRRNADKLPLALCLGRSLGMLQVSIPERESTPRISGTRHTELPDNSPFVLAQ